MKSKWMRSKDVVWEALNGEALLIQSSTGLRCALNSSAALIWELCDGERSLPDIVSAYATRVNQARRNAQKEVMELCHALAGSGLLISGVATPEAIMGGVSVCRSSSGAAPAFRLWGVGANSRRRPSPRGNSGPG